MGRQNIRKLLTFLSLLFFPITIYYFSPYLIIDGAIGGIVSGSFIVFIILFALSLFFGRLFCGYLCPMSGLQECLTLVQKKKVKGGKLHIIRYAIWVVWLMVISILFVSAGGINRFDFFYMTTNGISVVEPMAYIIYYGVIFLVVVLHLAVGKRAFCHYVCWISPFMVLGSRLGRGLHIKKAELKSNKDLCVNCGVCDKVCPMSLHISQKVQHEQSYDDECILCGECVDVCPKKAIKRTIRIWIRHNGD